MVQNTYLQERPLWFLPCLGKTPKYLTGATFRSPRIAQALAQFRIILLLPITRRTTGKDVGQMLFHDAGHHIGRYELRNNLTTTDKVWQGDVGDFQETRTQPVDKPSSPHIIAHDLRDPTEGGLQSGSARSDEGCRSGKKDVICLSKTDFGLRAQLLIQSSILCGCSRHHDIISLRHKRLHRRIHSGQIVAYLCRTRPGKQSNHRTTIRNRGRRHESHLIDRGVSHIGHGTAMLIPEEILLKRQNGEYMVHITSDAFHASLFPSPHLRGNVIVYGAECFTMNNLRHPQVESGIIYKDETVWPPSAYLVTALVKSTQYRAQM